MVNASLIKELREKTGAGMLDCKKALETTNGNIGEAIDWLREKGISKASKKADRIAAEGLTYALTNDNTAVILELNSETDFVAKNEEFISLINTIATTVLNNDVKTVEEALNLTVGDELLVDLITNKTATIGEKLSFRRFEKITKSEDEVFGTYIHMGGKITSLTLLKNTNEEVAKDVAMHVAAINPKYLNKGLVPEEVVEKEKEILTEQTINEGKPKEIAEKMVIGRINKFLKEICLEEQPFVKNPDVTVAEYVKNNSGEISTFIRYEVGEGIEKKEENFAEEVMNQIK